MKFLSWSAEPRHLGRASLLKKELENKVARYIVAEAEGKVIGYCGVWIIVDEGHITNVAVHRLSRTRHWKNAG